MKDTPAYQIPRITSAGSNMIIYRILRDLKDELQVFPVKSHNPDLSPSLPNR